MISRNIYTLSQLCQCIRDALYKDCDPLYFLKAEIASLNVSHGHAYFDLIEKSREGVLLAKIRGTCWKQTYVSVSTNFYQQTGQRVDVGMELLFTVEVQHHSLYGLSVNILFIDPVYTLGQLKKQKDLVIERLKSECLWDCQRQLSLPTIVRRIAVVSSSTAAGYEDFAVQLRESGIPFRISLFPAIMQGDSAESSLINALDEIRRQLQLWDAVVIIRGGGDTIDLSAFDSYDLCRSVATFPLPVITGVGHTRDVSILDRIVNLSLKTPTAVASDLIGRFTEQVLLLNQYRQRIHKVLSEQIISHNHQIQMYKARLQAILSHQLLINANKLQMFRQHLASLSPLSIFQQGYAVVTKNDVVLKSVKQVKCGDVLTVSLKDGSFKVIVQ